MGFTHTENWPLAESWEDAPGPAAVQRIPAASTLRPPAQAKQGHAPQQSYELSTEELNVFLIAIICVKKEKKKIQDLGVRWPVGLSGSSFHGAK